MHEELKARIRNARSFVEMQACLCDVVDLVPDFGAPSEPDEDESPELPTTPAVPLATTDPTPPTTLADSGGVVRVD